MASAAFEQNLAAWRADEAARMARWTRARTDQRCTFDQRVIPAGDAFRQVTKRNWPCCRDCAKARYQEDPPELPELKPLPVRVQQGAMFASFDRTTVAGRVRRKILDSRQRQSGEREPGEDG
jgi:hypothetical protein